MIFLKNYQRQIGNARTSEMLLNLRELCSATRVKSDKTDITAYADFVNYAILDRRNYTELRRRFFFAFIIIQ